MAVVKTAREVAFADLLVDAVIVAFNAVVVLLRWDETAFVVWLAAVVFGGGGV